MEDPQFSCCNGSCSLCSMDAPACCLAADQLYFLIFNKMVKGTDCIGAAAYAGKNSIRKLSFLFQHLLLNFFGDHSLEITYNGRERMGSHYRAKYIMGICDPVRPLSHGFRNCIL